MNVYKDENCTTTLQFFFLIILHRGSSINTYLINKFIKLGVFFQQYYYEIGAYRIRTIRGPQVISYIKPTSESASFLFGCLQEPKM